MLKKGDVIVKITKKFAAVAVSSLMMFSIAGMNVFAASTTQDGLEVSLTTDKEAYSKEEKITATLSVKNTNESDVTDIAMETIIPDGYEVADETKNNKQLDKLAPNESTELKVAYVAKSKGEVSQDSQVSQESQKSEVSTVSPSNDSPQTGDNTVIPFAIALVMLLSILLAIFCFKSKKGRKLLSLILCVSSVYGYFVLAPTKVNAVNTILKSLNISTSVKIERNDISLNAIVRYSTEIFENPLNEYEIDTDSDGIPDVIENQLGLNPNNDDTDGDHLTDYVEYVNGVTDPKTADTDGNGISDFDEDSDDDGLKNGEEQAAGSYAFNQDSDDDKLLDGDEVHKYSTDPMKKDTDGDGLTDYEEIKLGLDPLKISSDGSVNDSERKLLQTASDEAKDDLLRESDNWLIPQISGNVSGLLDNQVSMIKDESLSLNDNHSILSDVIEIDLSSTSALTLTFSFKENYTGNPEQLVIAYYDNDIHELNLVDSHLSEEQNKIEGEITSSGYYFVMDVDEFLKSLGIDVMRNINNQSIKTTSTSASTNSSIGKADIVFVVDTTGSMSSKIYNVQNNINTFADKMSNEYHVDMNYSLIEYRDIEKDGIDSTIAHNNLSSNWFTNVNTFKSEVSGLTVDGGDDAPETPIDALELARMSNWRNGAAKFVVLVTDAPYKENNTSGIKDMNEMAQKFASNGIIVSVITERESYYTNLLEQTHGLYGYIYSNFSDILLQLADVIGTETHKGGDWIILDDYSVVQLKGSIEEITTIDSDEDGLKDSEELIEKKTIDLKPLIALVLNLSSGTSIGEYIGNTEIEVWTFKSNPTIPDTDHDDILDRFDLKPRNNNYYPPTFVSYINNGIIPMDSMQETNDGFYICTVSVADMLYNQGVSSVRDDKGYYKQVQNFFDDWYLCAVKGTSTAYSLCKMREQENDSLIGDNDDPGVMIPFISLDVIKLTDVLFNHVDNSDLWNEINKVVLTGDSYNEVLQKYFSDVDSYAPYLIGELYVKKIASYSINNRISLPNKYNEILDEIAEIDETIRTLSRIPSYDDSTIAYLYVQREKLRRVPDALEQINNKVSSKIYYEDGRYLQLEDASNISKNEQLAILAAFTADISLNMFAAEVQAHAIFVVNWKSDLRNVPWLGNWLGGWYNSAIRADMAIGEEYESGLYDAYYDPNNNLVKEQVNAHGEK